MFNIREWQRTSDPSDRFIKEDRARLGLVYEIGKTIGSEPRMTQLLDQVIKMTQKTLNATAASVLLFGDNDEELFFEVASGPVGQNLRRVRVSTKTGVAGWVARNGKAMIVNDVNRDERFNKAIDETTGFTTRSIICVPLMLHCKVMGVIEVLNKLDGSDFTEQDLEAVVSVAATAAMAIENTRLHQNVLDAYKGTITTLAAAIDAKDPYTRGHSQRVMEYAMLGGASVLLPAEDMEALEYASLLHDIGKIAVDAWILNKPGALTTYEWNIIREHPVIGSNLLKSVPFLEKAGDLVLCHHERYDGTGYPAGLKGEEIPMVARLISVADAFDTMTTDRSYRRAQSVETAISELYACSGTQFCPIAVAAFISGFQLHKRTLPPVDSIPKAAVELSVLNP